jgi:adenylate kinase
VITGTPGVGKTTVSSLLAKKLGAAYLDLGELVKQKRFFSGYDKERNSLIADIKRLSRYVQKTMISSTQDFIIDGHYAADVVPAKKVFLAFVLRCDPQELAERLKKAGSGKREISENVAAEILDICLWDTLARYPSEIVCEIDTTGKEPSQVVKEIEMVLNGEMKATLGNVDWLGKLDREGKLDLVFHNFYQS